MPGFPDNLIDNLAAAFEPLNSALNDPIALSELLAEFGWAFDPASGGSISFQEGLGNVLADIQAVLDDLKNDRNKLADDVPTLVTSILQAAPQAVGTVLPFSLTEFWNGTNGGPGFLLDLFDYLLVVYLQNKIPLAYGLLRFIGVIDEVHQAPVPPSGSFPGRDAYVQKALNLSRLVSAVSKPQALFSDVYNWGNPSSNAFQAAKLLENLAAVFAGFDVDSVCGLASDSLYSVYYDTPAGSDPPVVPQLSIMPLSYLVGGKRVPGNFKISLNAVPIPALNSRTGDPVGLALFPLVSGQLGETIQLNDYVAITIKGNFSSVPILMEIRPSGVAITSLSSTLALTTISATARVDGSPGSNDPWTLIGDPEGSNLQLSGVHFSVGAGGPIADLEIIVELGLDKLALNIDFGEADGFLSGFLGSGTQGFGGSINLLWSSKAGFRFGASGSLKEVLPVHQSILDVVTIDEITIELGPKGTALELTISVTGGLSLGPLAASVEDVGFSVALDTRPASDAANSAGLIAASLGFKPPSGLGLSIDAGAVSGGGFILFDEEKGEYAGFLDISLVDMVQVKFIAILDTKLPDGSKGYSFIFIIFLELPPIQLGYGFTLNGVGGVAGINRTMVTSALQAGVYNHTLEYVINPPHTVADAPKVISAVSSFFPPAIGRYVFGPIVAIGWETFVQLTIGVILEVPDPIRLALLGIIDVGLPDVEEPDDAVVLLHILVLGTIDFGTKKLAIDGSMYGSRILEFPILGDFALRTSWGANPSSLFSMGGFNPHFNTSGLEVPQLHRLSISIGDGDNPQISANSYLALTSNTIQFGADVEVNVSEGGFKVHGYLGFDVLFVIAPPTVSFEFDFAAGFDVSYNGANLAGVSVTGTLTGTTPWHFHGEGTVHLLCFSASKSVDKTWGDSITPLPPPTAILPDLIPSLSDPRNWSAMLPDRTGPGATLSAPPADQKTILVHPMGTFTVRQKIVPFDFAVTHYKNGIPSDGHYFSLGDVTLNGAKVSKEAFPDAFATGQFIDLSDADKLNRSSFDQYNAGAKIASSILNAGADATRTVESTEFYLDDPISPLRLSGTYVMPTTVFGVLSQPGMAPRFSVKNTGLNKYKTVPSTPAAVTREPTYVVASTDDLSVRSDIVAGGATYYRARAALRTHLAKNPEDADKLQILPAHEVAA